jgi:hypothetical protein
MFPSAIISGKNEHGWWGFRVAHCSHSNLIAIYMLVKLRLYMDETKTTLQVVVVEKADGWGESLFILSVTQL